MTSTRKISLTAGLFYLLTFVSIPTLFLYNAVRGADYVIGSGPDTSVYIGSVLEIVVALAGIGTAVALYPVVKRQNEGVALGFVAVRTLEAGAIFAGVFTLLAIVTLRQAGAGASALVTGQTLAGLHDWTFTLSQSLLPAVNALLIGSLLYQSRLVPRVLPLLGFVGAALLVTSTMATLFGANEYGSAMSGLLRDPDRRVGVLAGRLPGRQGIPCGRSAAARLRAGRARRARRHGRSQGRASSGGVTGALTPGQADGHLVPGLKVATMRSTEAEGVWEASGAPGLGRI